MKSPRKLLLALLALCSLHLARSDWIPSELLQFSETYNTHSGPSISTQAFGAFDGDDYAFTLDYFNPGVAVDEIEFYVGFTSDLGDASDYAYSGALEADEDFGWLDAGFTIPSGAQGQFFVQVTIYYADSTVTFREASWDNFE